MNKLKIRYAFIGLISPFLKKLLKIRSTFIDNNNLRILYFHNIPFEQLDNFKRLIEFISEKFGFVSPQEVESFLRGQYIANTLKFLLTFDDGFASNMIVAREVLNPKGIKAIFFIPLDFIGLKGLPLKEFISRNVYAGRMKTWEISESLTSMSWEDIRYLAKAGHTIGAHTLSHVCLSQLTDESAIENEIVGAADMLENELGLKIEWFAYPFGNNESIDIRAYKTIRKRYRYCCTGLRGNNTPETNSYYFQRDCIDLNAPVYYTRFILDGGLDFLYTRKMKKLKHLTGGE